MSYRFLFISFLCILSLGMLFWFSDSLRTPLFGITDGIKVTYRSMLESIFQGYDRFILQSQTIRKYQAQEVEYEKNKLALLELQSQIDLILKFYPEIHLLQNSSFSPILTISYVEIGEYRRVWLRGGKDFKEGRVYGLLRDGYALGVAVKKNGRLMGIFNGDERAAYSVYIGKNKIPAFIHNYPADKTKILADYIPQYLSVQIGDEVYTSGLDNTFIPGIPVGKVEQILDENGYISALISPYANIQSPGYLWIIDRKENDGD